MRYTGDSGVISIGGNDIIELTGFTLDESADTIDTTTMDGSCAKDSEAGTISYSGTIDLHYEFTDPATLNLVVGATVAVIFYPIGVVSGMESLTGTILVTAMSIPVERDSMVMKSITFEGKGQLVRGVVP